MPKESPVVLECRQELESIRKQAKGDPQREMIALWLMALEREEIATVSYRDHLIAKRLEKMPIPASTRSLIRHALIWIWKDEEMHTVYTRGALYRLGSRWLRIKTLVSQMSGALGGFAASAKHQLTWREAPLTRLFADIAVPLGALLGRVPKEVQQHLKHGSFRDFCLFNIEAEQTALVCWERITELATEQLHLPEEQIATFHRVARDETNHQAIFEAIAAALDNNDSLRSEELEDQLKEQIQAVGTQFLPPELRTPPKPSVKIAAGGTVFCHAGNGTKVDEFEAFLEASDMKDALEEAARDSGREISQLSIAIKPTLMYAFSKLERTSLIDTDLLFSLIRHLEKLGASKENLFLIDGSNLYSEYFENRSVADVAEHFGYTQLGIPVVDATEDSVPHQYFHGMGQQVASKSWKDADFRISFPKLRSHPYNVGYLSIDNLEGLGNPSDDHVFTERYAELHTTNLMLLHDFPVHYAVIDAHSDIADGMLGIFGSSRPRSPRRFYGGRDPIAVDITCGRHIGYRSPHDSLFTGTAVFWFGDPSERCHVEGEDSPISPWSSPNKGLIRNIVRLVAHPVYEFGSFRGQLFFPDVETAAFPYKVAPVGWIGATNRLVRLLFGLPTLHR